MFNCSDSDEEDCALATYENARSNAISLGGPVATAASAGMVPQGQPTAQATPERRAKSSGFLGSLFGGRSLAGPPPPPPAHAKREKARKKKSHWRSAPTGKFYCVT